MKKASLLDDYLNKYAASSHWTLYAKSLDHIERVVVIPAYAELEMLFDTLASLSENAVSYLATTLIICVINNKVDAPASARENNTTTMEILTALIDRRCCDLCNIDQARNDLLRKIAESRIRLGYIDASSPGLEIPKNVGGVGMARKIGMDMALRILRNAEDKVRLIFSLDADTLVQTDYLQAIQDAFDRRNMSTAVISYEHQMPQDAVRRSAISSYEIFLRYWVWGLKYAGSLYAFHSIGSTIVTTDRVYLSVRGMNRREAGEDFYFLNKLAKISPIHTINDTKVYPSARISERVPFGTGAAVGKITSYQDRKHGFYDPRIFVILKLWLECLETSYATDADKILKTAKNIHGGLQNFLIERKFVEVWPKIIRNVKDTQTYRRQIHGWFDGFETLKLINDLTRKYFPKIDMVPAIINMLALYGDEIPVSFREILNHMLDDQNALLKCMQKYELFKNPSR